MDRRSEPGELHAGRHQLARIQPFHYRNLTAFAILAWMQVTRATDSERPSVVPGADQGLAADLYAVMAHMQRHCNADLFETVGALELTLTQTKLLHQLDQAGVAVTLGQAAELVHISHAAASRTVEDLVRRGYLKRREDAQDRRMKRIELSAAGRSVTHRLNAGRLSGLESFVSQLSGEERTKLGDAVGLLLEHEDIAACRPRVHE